MQRSVCVYTHNVEEHLMQIDGVRSRTRNINSFDVMSCRRFIAPGCSITYFDRYRNEFSTLCINNTIMILQNDVGYKRASSGLRINLEDRVVYVHIVLAIVVGGGGTTLRYCFWKPDKIIQYTLILFTRTQYSCVGGRSNKSRTIYR